MAKIDPNSISVRSNRRIDQSLFIESFASVADTFGGGVNDVVLKRLYDRNGTLIDHRISTDPPTFVQGKVQVDPEADIHEFGFSSGEFRIDYSFWRIMVGTKDSTGVYVNEISPSRTEVRILPTTGNEDSFAKFAIAQLSDDELNRILDFIFNPPEEALPHVGFDAELIVNDLDDDFKREIFRFDRAGNNSPLDESVYLSDILTGKIDGIVTNTRQSVFEYIRLNGLSSQDELKEILRREFKNNIRQEFE